MRNIKNDDYVFVNCQFFIDFNEIKERGYEGRIVDALAETNDEGRSWVR